MSADHLHRLDVINNPHGKAINSPTRLLFGLTISDWLLLLTGIGLAAAILLFF